MSLAVVSAVLFIVLSLKLILNARRSSSKKGNLPPSPPSLPILGHLFYVKKPLHNTYASLAAEYGPIFSLRVGSRRIVIVSSPSLVQECFSGKNDQVFANRPPFLNSKYVAYNNTTVGTAPYGPHWRNLRRIYTIEMLTSQRLSLFQPIRSDELRRMVAKLARDASAGGFAAVDLRKTVATVVMNNVMRVIAGKRYYDEDGGRSKEEASSRFHAVIQDVMDKSGAGNLADYFPILTWMRSKYVKRVKELGFRMNEFMQGLVDEMRNKGERNDTMLGRLLVLQEKEPHVYTDEIIKGLIQGKTVF
ncbi:PREDICTED: cytochrome P450 81E8-like isoform X2 [Tarenaya hassleriana]|uniref:cytochrome P450 81E8-like isoform X2 n=1 Tax=Tarenaya hassleriana TaxID=28532 RepID=UPI00053C876A|nr:PREDICTED: cytochrome P450 81E8-like isoform X2 [Tarenaya hassleriana]